MDRAPRHQYPIAYYQGRKCRIQGRAKMVPSTLSPIQRSWWLGGWHDADMEELSEGR